MKLCRKRIGILSRKIQSVFNRISAMGYVQSLREGNTGVGKTLEEYFGIVENNSSGADFMGYEIKSHRTLSESYITLFTKKPTFPNNIDTTLREKYGSQDAHFDSMRVLHTSVFAPYWTSHSTGFSYKLDLQDRKVHLHIKNTRTGKLCHTGPIFWTYADLRYTLEHKLRKLAFVEADSKTIEDKEWFHYKRLTLFHGVSFDKFLSQLRAGNIMMDIRIGVYKTEGKNYGKTHNHGMAFRIKKECFESLYDNSKADASRFYAWEY